MTIFGCATMEYKMQRIPLSVPILSVFDLLLRPADLETPFVEQEETLHRDLFRRWHDNQPDAYTLVRGVMQGGLRIDRIRSAHGVVLTCPADLDRGGHETLWAAIFAVRHLCQFQGRVTVIAFAARQQGFREPVRWPEQANRLIVHINPTDVNALIRDILARGVQR